MKRLWMCEICKVGLEMAVSPLRNSYLHRDKESDPPRPVIALCSECYYIVKSISPVGLPWVTSVIYNKAVGIDQLNFEETKKRLMDGGKWDEVIMTRVVKRLEGGKR